jgi:hypothetical protein
MHTRKVHYAVISPNVHAYNKVVASEVTSPKIQNASESRRFEPYTSRYVPVREGSSFSKERTPSEAISLQRALEKQKQHEENI